MREENTNMERKVYEAINKAIKGKENDKTKVIKEALCDLGHELGYIVYSSSVGKADHGEWMYDLCWSIEGDTWRDFRGLQLICEIELKTNIDEILMDFQKLTIGLSNYRLFVFMNDKKTEEILPILRRCAEAADRCEEACRGPRRHYVLIGVPKVKGENCCLLQI